MPIGFWAISRNNLKEIWAFQQENDLRYRKDNPTEYDIDCIIHEMKPQLDALVEREVQVGMTHRHLVNNKKS